jgi:1-acyl-sn-glycerol-3-phosphate acyltransferase
MGRFRMLARLGAFTVWTLLLLPVQLVLIYLPRRTDLTRRAKIRIPLLYWSGVARILGVNLDVTGVVEPNTTRPILFIANHSSWLDIVCLGAVLPGCFVAKGEIARWPGVNLIAKAGRTIFVSRRHRSANRERTEMQTRLEAGDNLILFPEGTTSDGARVMPFHATFLALAADASNPIVQPVTIVYDQMDSLPICRRNRPRVAWYGDMDIASHYAQLGRHTWRARIILHTPVPATTNRKTLAADLQELIADQAAIVRQGR